MKSTKKNISFGVPQGGIMGPLLFQACINDLPFFIKLSKFTFFVDDSTVVIRDNNTEATSFKCIVFG